MLTPPTEWIADWATRPRCASFAFAAAWHPLADWPTQGDYDQLLHHARQHTPNLPTALRFVLDLDPEAYYEMHIAQTGEVPTRAQNWHDWFNALAWLAWPRLKTALNQRHHWAIAEQGESRRGPYRDAATLLDESGVLVPYADSRLADALDAMDWHYLFVERRDAWGRDIAAHTIGHAIAEASLTPFIGWTAKAWLIEVEPAFFAASPAEQRAHLDRRCAQALSDPAQLSTPRQLPPLPVLGIPHEWPANADPAFYRDTDYFRPSRRNPMLATRLKLADHTPTL